MKNDHILYVLTGGCVIASLCFIMLSWVGNICGWPVESLLTQESIRWFLKTMFFRMEASNGLELFIILMGISNLLDSGWLPAIIRIGRHRNGHLFRKKRQALFLSCLLGICYIIIVGWCTFSNEAILSGVTGTLDRSSFWVGWPVLLMFGCVLMGTVYGLASGQFRSLTNVFASLAVLPSKMTGCFVYLFIVVQLFDIFHQAHFASWIGMDEMIVQLVRYACYYVPFVYFLFVCLYGENHRVTNKS